LLLALALVLVLGFKESANCFFIASTSAFNLSFSACKLASFVFIFVSIFVFAFAFVSEIDGGRQGRCSRLISGREG
jgi:hypothetical protein